MTTNTESQTTDFGPVKPFDLTGTILGIDAGGFWQYLEFEGEVYRRNPGGVFRWCCHRWFWDQSDSTGLSYGERCLTFSGVA